MTYYDADNESDIAGESDRFDWQGDVIVPRKPSTVRRKRQLATFNHKDSTFRKDEPQAGSIVIVANITVLDEYLVGTARSPFRTPRSSYIIILRNAHDDWQEDVERVLRKLWRVYGIVNALLLAPCLDSGEEMVATYFPYAVNKSIVDPLANDFGATTFTPISDMDFPMRFLRKLKQMNGFPFRVSIFDRYPTAIKPPDVSEIVQRSYYNRAMRFSGGFGGFDGMVLGNIADKMRFRTIVVTPSISDFGWVDRNGSSFGK